MWRRKSTTREQPNPPPQDVEASFELAAAQSTESCEAVSSSSPPPTVTARLSRSTRRVNVAIDPVASAMPAPAPARLLEATVSPLASNLASALAARPPRSRSPNYRQAARPQRRRAATPCRETHRRHRTRMRRCARLDNCPCSARSTRSSLQAPRQSPPRSSQSASPLRPVRLSWHRSIALRRGEPVILRDVHAAEGASRQRTAPPPRPRPSRRDCGAESSLRPRPRQSSWRLSNRPRQSRCVPLHTTLRKSAVPPSTTEAPAPSFAVFAVNTTLWTTLVLEA